jgi:hypothetical protein
VLLSGLLYLHTLNEFLVSLQLTKTAGLFKTPPPPAPSKRDNQELLQMSPKKIRRQEEKRVLDAVTMSPLFSNFKEKFNGYTSHFLKTKSYLLLKFTAQKLIFSKFNSVGIFDMDPAIRSDFYSQIDALLTSYPKDAYKSKKNPFEINHEGEEKSGIFIRLSPKCLFFRKENGNVCEILKKDLPAVGKIFSGRALILIKGVSISPDGGIIAPMASICQVLLQKTDFVHENVWEQQCLLDEEEIQPQQQQQREEYDANEFLEDLSHFYLGRPKPTYSPVDEPKADSYTADDTLKKVLEKPRLNGYSAEGCSDDDDDEDEGLFE